MLNSGLSARFRDFGSANGNRCIFLLVEVKLVARTGTVYTYLSYIPFKTHGRLHPLTLHAPYRILLKNCAQIWDTSTSLQPFLAPLTTQVRHSLLSLSSSRVVFNSTHTINMSKQWYHSVRFRLFLALLPSRLTICAFAPLDLCHFSCSSVRQNAQFSASFL